MPRYDYQCSAGHIFEALVPLARAPEMRYCACGEPASRLAVNHINFAMDKRTTESVPLKTYYDEAREMEYQVSRTDDPGLVESGTRIAHAAKVRAHAQILAGHETWRPDKHWKQEEPE